MKNTRAAYYSLRSHYRKARNEACKAIAYQTGGSFEASNALYSAGQALTNNFDPHFNRPVPGFALKFKVTNTCQRFLRSH